MKRPLPLFLLAYGAGILTGSEWPFPLSWAMAGILAGSLVLLVCLREGKGRTALVISPPLFFLLGLLAIGPISHPEFPAHHLVHFSGEKPYPIEGVLDRPPEGAPEKTLLYLRAERIYLDEASFPVTGRLLITVRGGGSPLRYGDRVRFISRLYRPRPAGNPGGFDYQRYLARQGIWATAYVNDPREVVRLEEGKGNFFLHLVERRREEIRSFLERAAPPRSRGIMRALILGERGEIDREVNEKFIASGVTHILSISGLHVALVAAFSFALVRLLLRFFPALLLRVDLNKASALAAVAPVVLYTFLAGLGVAAVRAMIMALTFLLALLLEREKDLYDALLLAAFLILAAAPAALFDLSFQLSFTSVLAILYLVPRLGEFFRPWQKWLEEQPGWRRKLVLFAGAGLLTSTAAIIGTAPLVVRYFNRLSLAGFLSNLLLVPLMGMGGTLLSLLTALFVFLFPPLAQVLTRINGWILDLSLSLVDFFSRLPLASIRLRTPTLLEILLFYGLILTTANLKRWRRALPGAIGLAGLLAALQIFPGFPAHPEGALSVTFLDVGQGDAAVVRFPRGEVMVIDGGGSPDGSFDPGERIVAPYLWKIRGARIDYLINSHPHPDHLQGLLFLLDQFPVGRVWDNGQGGGSSPLAERFHQLSGGRRRTVARGEILRIGEAQVEVLHPPPGREGEGFLENDASLVLRLTLGEVSFLFAGDVEEAAEREILRRRADLKSTVLKVPHHGSRSSSLPEFLDRVRPEYAVFTVRGGGSRLPHPSILTRYEERGIRILRTDRTGAVTFFTRGRDLEVRTFRAAEPPVLTWAQFFHKILNF